MGDNATARDARTDQGAGPVLLDERLLLRALLGVILVLNVGGAITIAVLPESDNGKWLYLGLERNPSTWFSSAQLALAALLAFAVGHARADRRHWNLVAVLLVVMSLDETATFHEKLGGLPGIPHIGSRAWVGAALIIVALVGARLIPWAVTQLEAHLRNGLLVGAGVFLVGAVGMESAAGYWHDSHSEDRTFWALSGLEENFEMLGVTVVVMMLVRELRRSGARLTLGVRP